MVHGDDFTSLGEAKDISWLEEEMKKMFEVNIRGRIGWEEEDEKSIRILNRVVTCTEEGIE